MMELRDNVKKIFLDAKGDVKSNADTWDKMQEALGKFSEANAYATSKYVQVNKMQAEAAKTERPDLKEKMLAHVEAQKKSDLYQEVKPFQQTMDYSPESIFMLGQAKTGEALKPATGYYDAQGNIKMDVNTNSDGSGSSPSQKGKGAANPVSTSQFYTSTIQKSPDGFTNITKSVIDYDKILESVDINYQKNNGLGSFYETNQGINEYLGGDKTGDINKAANKKIAEYNEVRKLNGYFGPDLKPIEILRDTDGTPIKDAQGNIQSKNGDSIPVLKAKLNLMGVPLTYTGTDKDQDAIDIAKAKATIGKENAQGKAAVINANANMKKANSDAAKKASEIRKINSEVKRLKAQGAFINTEAIQMFDVDRYKNGEDIKESLSPIQMNYIAKTLQDGDTKTGIKRANIRSIVYDYSDVNNPMLKISVGGIPAIPATKDKPGKPAVSADIYTIRPTDIRAGVAKEFGYDAKSIDNAEVDWNERTGSTDFNGYAVPQFNKEKVTPYQKAYDNARAQGLSEKDAREIAEDYKKIKKN